MRILICTKYDIAGSVILNRLVPALADHDVHVVLANRQRPDQGEVAALREQKLYEELLLRRVVFPLIDRGASSGAELLTFAGLAARYGVGLVDLGDPDRGVITRHVVELEPELVVSAQFGFIFRAAALTTPRLGLLNLHSGELPRRAGVNPTFWCMLDGDEHAGCTLHRVTASIDTGPIVAAARIEIDYDRSLFANWLANFEAGCGLIVDAVQTLAAGRELPSTAQDLSVREYVPRPTQADFERLAARGVEAFAAEDYLRLLERY